jgi:hypothetical protein
MDFRIIRPRRIGNIPTRFPINPMNFVRGSQGSFARLTIPLGACTGSKKTPLSIASLIGP